MAPKAKQTFGVLMPQSMPLNMDGATNVLIQLNALFPTAAGKVTPDTDSSVPADAIVDAPELARLVYGEHSKETRVRRFDCSNDLVLVTALETAEQRAKRTAHKQDKDAAEAAIEAVAQAAAANTTAKAKAQDKAQDKAQSKAQEKAPEKPAEQPANKEKTPEPATAADAKAAPAGDAKAPAEVAAASGAGDAEKKKKKKKKKPAAAAAAGAAAAAAPAGAPATAAAKPAAAKPPAAKAAGGGSGTGLTLANAWGSMCVNAYRFEGNSEKWIEVCGPVLMFAHPRVAKSRGGSSHYRVVDAKKLLSATFDDEALAKQRAAHATNTWEGKNQAQRDRRDMRGRDAATKELAAAIAKPTGPLVSLPVAPAPAAAAAAAGPAAAAAAATPAAGK